MSKATLLTCKAKEAIRWSILKGEYQPGERLNIEQLKLNLEIGITPIREALNQLVSMHLVDAIPNAGFKVAEISHEEIKDICRARRLVDFEALRLSFEKGDDNWEAEVMAAFHCLSKLETSSEFLACPKVTEWAERYARFYRSLLSACESPWLLKLSDSLFQAAQRYRFLVFGYGKDIHVLIEKKMLTQKSLLEAALSRQPDAAIALLNEMFDRFLHKVSILTLKS